MDEFSDSPIQASLMNQITYGRPDEEMTLEDVDREQNPHIDDQDIYDARDQGWSALAGPPAAHAMPSARHAVSQLAPESASVHVGPAKA